MHRLRDLSLVDTISITRNPRGFFLYGWEENFYLAATGINCPRKRLNYLNGSQSNRQSSKNQNNGHVQQDEEELFDMIIGGDVDPDIHHFNILPCNPTIWPKLRDSANIIQPGIWNEDATFEDHLIQAVRALVNDPNYELNTFPTCTMPYVRSKRSNKELTFEQHYRQVLIEPPLALGKQSLWICWGNLIRQGIPLYAVRQPDDTRIKSLHEPMKCMLLGCSEPCISHCGQCGWKFYCSRDHQVADWMRHKKECYPYR